MSTSTVAENPICTQCRDHLAPTYRKAALLSAAVNGFWLTKGEGSELNIDEVYATADLAMDLRDELHRLSDWSSA